MRCPPGGASTDTELGRRIRERRSGDLWRRASCRISPDSLAGAGGFEPPYGGIKIRCLTAWRRPKARRTIVAVSWAGNHLCEFNTCETPQRGWSAPLLGTPDLRAGTALPGQGQRGTRCRRRRRVAPLTCKPPAQTAVRSNSRRSRWLGSQSHICLNHDLQAPVPQREAAGRSDSRSHAHILPHVPCRQRRQRYVSAGRCSRFRFC